MPTREQVRRAIKAIKRYADYEYFFNELKSPDWIGPLLQEDMFKKPPEPIREDSFIRFPLWPESRYLARVAGKAPELVLKVIRQIPETENVRVHEDFIDAALLMPPALAGKLVDQATRWLNSPYELLLPHKLGELLGHLARGRQIEPALKLARELLELRAPSVPAGETEDFGREPQPRFREYEYKRILKRQIPILVGAAARPTADLLAEILENANRIAVRDQSSPRDGERLLDDYSYVWRPAIEEHEQNHGYDIRDPLVTALRGALESVAAGEPTGLSRLVLNLEQRRWLIFYRFALYLLSRFPKGARAALVERATDEWRFDDSRLRHEYGSLLRSCFRGLPKNAQARILTLIDAGPPLDSFKVRASEHYGRPPSEEEIDRYVKHWKLEKLALIGNQQLPASWQQRYAEWTRDVGEPEHPDFPVYSGATWVGPTSPKTSADLASMSVSEIISFLATWEPTQAWMSPSREGVGRQLEAVVASEPQRFVEQAEAFEALHPAYVSALLSGLRDAGKDKTFDWRPVLRLCEWVIGRSAEDANAVRSPADIEEEPDWRWARRAVANLVERACLTGPSQAPIELRAQLWSVVLPLTSDIEPTPEYEARYGGSNMDPSTLALNTTRGKAIHAVMRYASWVRHAATQGQPGTSIEIPEVWTALHEHLDPLRDPSPAIRSVYGQWLPWLISWDRTWVESHLRLIFPREDTLARLRDAAWDSYVIFSPAYNDAFEVLRGEYRAAIDRMNRPREGRELGDPIEKLGEHLIVFYWRGRLSDTDELLVGFYKNASASVRRHVMRFAGISLENTKDEVPSDILERLKSFWLWRVEQLRTSQDARGFEELAEFGWWFASGKLESEWALDQLSTALALAGRVEPENQVLEKLAAVASEIPRRAMQLLRAMIERATEPGRVLAWTDEIRGILTAALKSKQRPAAEMATDLIHDLGARNVRDYADLLKT